MRSLKINLIKKHNKLILFLFFAGLFFLHVTFPRILNKLDLLMIISELTFLRILFLIPQAIKVFSAIRNCRGSFSDKILSVLPKNLVGLVRLEIAHQKGFINWLIRKKIDTHLEGKTFGHWKTSQYPTVFIILCLAVVIDISITSLMVESILKNHPHKEIIHCTVLFSTLYFLAWIIADRHLVKNTFQVINSNALHLTVGARFNATLPWGSVTDASILAQSKELNETRNMWLRRNSFNPSSTVIATPMDQPNVVLKLKNQHLVLIEKFKIEKNNVDTIMIYVDDPYIFLNEINNNIKAP